MRWDWEGLSPKEMEAELEEMERCLEEGRCLSCGSPPWEWDIREGFLCVCLCHTQWDFGGEA